MNNDSILRKNLLELLSGGSAHLDFDKAVAKLPPKLRGGKPAGQPHTPWRLVEHMRIAQWDILEFCRDPRHKSPKWPEEYWPAGDAPPSDAAWKKTVAGFKADLKSMKKLVGDSKSDLFSRIPGGEGQTLFREALLVADHNAYHLGELIIVRRLLRAWED